MPVYVDWDNEDRTVIRYDLAGHWDWHAFEVAVEQSFAMTESVTHTVHVIIDMRQSMSMPDGAILYFKRLLQAAPANHGLYMMVSENQEVDKMLVMFRRIHRRNHHRIQQAATLDEARGRLSSPQKVAQ